MLVRMPTFRPTRFGLIGIALCVGVVVGIGQASAQEGLTGQQVTGVDAPKPIPEVELAQELSTVPVPRTASRPNQTIIDASPLPRDKAPQLDYVEQTGNFTIGQVVNGAVSGARATILLDDDEGDEGTLTLDQVEGEFQDGEPISDESGGAAIVNGEMREGVWVLDFAFKPLRIRTIERSDSGRRQEILYLYYRVINRTGRPRMFVPQFFLVTNRGQRYPDIVLPEAVEVVQAREAPQIPLLGAVDVTGIIPPSTREGIDDAVFGVAIWEIDDNLRQSKAMNVFVRGLSDGFRVVPSPEGEDGEPTTSYKTLRIDFAMPGDTLRERAVRLLEPPYEWIYY